MYGRTSCKKHIGICLTGFLLLCVQGVVAATSSGQIETLIAKGNLQQALSLTNEQLAVDKANVSFLFLKGLILTKQNKLEQARDIFFDLSVKHPELPEPYNNLAVVYAALGDFNSAREALQNAINTHPSYATAHENMGDIYAKMASRAYNQALELDSENETAREKLSLVSEMFSSKIAEQENNIKANQVEAEKLSADLNRLEKELSESESKTLQESTKVNQLR